MAQILAVWGGDGTDPRSCPRAQYFPPWGPVKKPIELRVWKMGTVAVALVLAGGAGLFCYFVRCRQPISYGLIEIGVGLAIIFVTFFPQTPYLLYDTPPWWGVQLSRFLGFIAGVYVIVRGLDNIERGLPSLSPTAHRTWRRVFYGKG
jgi:hypothetical protein